MVGEDVIDGVVVIVSEGVGETDGDGVTD